MLMLGTSDGLGDGYSVGQSLEPHQEGWKVRVG